MEVRIESMICLWDDTIPKMFLEFVNLLTLATSEEQLRRSVKDFAEKHELDKFFLYGWKSHSTLTLLATQDLPTFLYYMIDPLKSWCWGAILFYPFTLLKILVFLRF